MFTIELPEQVDEVFDANKVNSNTIAVPKPSSPTRWAVKAQRLRSRQVKACCYEPLRHLFSQCTSVSPTFTWPRKAKDLRCPTVLGHRSVLHSLLVVGSEDRRIMFASVHGRFSAEAHTMVCTISLALRLHALACAHATHPVSWVAVDPAWLANRVREWLRCARPWI